MMPTLVFHPHNLSGWLLPDGRWYPTQEWWHISGLYDIRDEGYSSLQTQESYQLLLEGDEEKIRNFVSNLGFIKISRTQLDGEFINLSQLMTLKKLLILFDPECEFEVLSAKIGFVKKISVQRISKLKSGQSLFRC